MALSHSGLLGLDFERRGGLLGLEKKTFWARAKPPPPLPQDNQFLPDQETCPREWFAQQNPFPKGCAGWSRQQVPLGRVSTGGQCASRATRGGQFNSRIPK